MTRDFFREEYRLNHQIHRFPKPYVALIDGVTMGGGLGLSIYGSHRVATERTAAAMPETGIGFFPDVGASYFLNRMPGHLGMYLALTGDRLSGADLLEAGLATHFVKRQDLPALEQALTQAQWPAAPHRAVTEIVQTFSADPGEARLGSHRAAIDDYFAGESVEDIVRALERSGTAFAREVRRSLAEKSPTSLKVVHRQIRKGRDLSLEEALRREYRLSQRFVSAHDFCEGVRAALVDKDHRPSWQPRRLEDVREADVTAYFAPLAAGELDFPPD